MRNRWEEPVDDGRRHDPSALPQLFRRDGRNLPPLKGGTVRGLSRPLRHHCIPGAPNSRTVGGTGSSPPAAQNFAFTLRPIAFASPPVQ